MPDRQPQPPPRPTEYPWEKFPEEGLRRAVTTLKNASTEFEEMLALIDDALTEDERKRLDKAVTLVKVGIKMAKKVARHRERMLSDAATAA